MVRTERVDLLIFRPGTVDHSLLLHKLPTPPPPLKSLQLAVLCKLPWNDVSLHYQIKVFILTISVLLGFLTFSGIWLAFKTELLFYFQNLTLVLLRYLDVGKGMYQWDSPNEWNKGTSLPRISQDLPTQDSVSFDSKLRQYCSGSQTEDK